MFDASHLSEPSVHRFHGAAVNLRAEVSVCGEEKEIGSTQESRIREFQHQKRKRRRGLILQDFLTQILFLSSSQCH